MDVVMLSRLQFAVAVFFHFIFVPLTLGLAVILALMETKYVRTGDVLYKRMAQFWGKLFLINFTLGVVTGITLEFQFGTNWSRYSAYVGDIFGSLLAIEATVAFFLESTFLAVWVFGWERLSKKVHLFAIWMVAIASNVSALWIIFANGWMQNPVGYVIRNGRAELTDFIAVITNPYAWGQYLHTVSAAWMLGAFFVMAVSGWHLLRKNEENFFRTSFKLVAPFGLVVTILALFFGHLQGQNVAHFQPVKLAAMESQWETEKPAPFYLLVLPDPANERNAIEALGLPGMGSFVAYNSFSAEVKGLKAFPAEDRPSVNVAFYSFRFMLAMAALFFLLAWMGWRIRNNPEQKPWVLKAFLYTIPLPYITIMAGWMLAEMGRQPWIVYGLMRTKDAVSPVPVSSVAISLLAFIVVYSFLGILDIYLLRKYARKGPLPAAPQNSCEDAPC